MDIKTKKLEGLIKVKLSLLLLKGLKDPRLESFITILDVSLSKDGRTARVVVSVIGTDEEKQSVIRGLESARGYIQMRLGKELRVRYIPHLFFQLDDKTEERVRLVHRLTELERNEDSEHPDGEHTGNTDKLVPGE
jgi:ribosome-binding factor A